MSGSRPHGPGERRDRAPPVPGAAAAGGPGELPVPDRAPRRAGLSVPQPRSAGGAQPRAGGTGETAGSGLEPALAPRGQGWFNPPRPGVGSQRHPGGVPASPRSS